MTRPTFLIIGAMKAGTDSLWEYLRRHPEIFMAEVKELDYFVEELNWPRGPAWYAEQFAASNGARAIGEASTNYTKYPVYCGVAARIARALPDVRLVYLVRHPVERMRSQYLHQRLLGEERRPIEEALVDPLYMNLSRYMHQIEQYLEHFDRRRILVVTSEDLRERRDKTVSQVLEFVGVDAAWRHPALAREFHRTKEKRVLRTPFRLAQRLPGYSFLSRAIPEPLRRRTQALRTRGIDSQQEGAIRPDMWQRLEELVRDDVTQLREFLGPGFSGWGLV